MVRGSKLGTAKRITADRILRSVAAIIGLLFENQYKWNQNNKRLENVE